MVLALAGALVAVPCLGTPASRPTDYDVKAAYLYNFGRFVEWPQSVTSNSDLFTVCVLGQDPFGPALDATLAGEAIGGKRAAAKRISTPQEAATCQILFMSSTEESRLGEILETLRKEAVIDEIYLGPDQFYRVIDVAVRRVDAEGCTVFMAISGHAPCAFEQTWNQPPGSGPFKQVIASIIEE